MINDWTFSALKEVYELFGAIASTFPECFGDSQIQSFVRKVLDELKLQVLYDSILTIRDSHITLLVETDITNLITYFFRLSITVSCYESLYTLCFKFYIIFC